MEEPEGDGGLVQLVLLILLIIALIFVSPCSR